MLSKDSQNAFWSMARHRPRAAWLALALLVGIGGGCSFFGAGDAKINNMVAAGDLFGNTRPDGELEVTLSIEFLQIPEGIDPQDVKVVFEGNTLEAGAITEFDWAYIASKAKQKMGGGQWGRKAIPGLSPDSDPILNQEMDIFFNLDLEQRTETQGDLYVVATLYWGGQKQDSIRRSISHLYEREK